METPRADAEAAEGKSSGGVAMHPPTVHDRVGTTTAPGLAMIMAYESLRILLPALAVAAGTLAHAAPAQACSPDPCDASDRWASFEAAHQAVATDGVLVFSARRGSLGQLTADEALSAITLDVRDAGGEPIPGTLEAVEGIDAVLFRPDAALAASEQITFTAVIDNASIDDVSECDAGELAPGSFEVGADPLPAFAAPDFLLSAVAQIDASTDLAQFVCCDGAFPAEALDSCDQAYPEYAEGYCTALAGVGYVRAELTLAEGAELDEVVAANTIVRLVRDDELGQVAALGGSDLALSLLGTEAFDARWEIVNLATGEILAGEPASMGEDLADQLGELQLDPTEALGANCEEPAYTCAVIDVAGDLRGWDEAACSPWDDGDTDTDGETDGETSGETDGETEGGSDSDSDSATDSDSDSGTESDAASDSDSAGASNDGDGGCGCSADADGSNAAGLLGLLGFGLLGFRRRRR